MAFGDVMFEGRDVDMVGGWRLDLWTEFGDEGRRWVVGLGCDGDGSEVSVCYGRVQTSKPYELTKTRACGGKQAKRGG